MEAPLRRKQIAEVALKIVAEEGLSSVTVRRVADAVGTSATALYRHFKNKADILRVVLEEHHEVHMENIRKARAEATSPLDAMRLLYSMIMEYLENYRALPIIFVSDLVWFKDIRLKNLKMHHHTCMRNAMVDIITQGQVIGEIRNDIAAEEIFVNYLGMIAMPAMLITRDIDEVNIKRQHDANWKLFAKAVHS
jgi:AcrR family transcriptional regulator